MLIVYLFTSLLGALATIAVLSSYGWMVALLSAPFGGSVLTLIVAGLYLLSTAQGSLWPAVFTARH
jgi:hypothetical protein